MKSIPKDKLNELKNIALEKYELKLNNPDDFGLLSVRRSLLVNSVVALRDNTLLSKSESATLQDFVNNYQTISPDKLESISKIIVKK